MSRLISYDRARNVGWYQRLSLEERNDLKTKLRRRQELLKELGPLEIRVLAEGLGISKPTLNKFDKQLRDAK